MGARFCVVNVIALAGPSEIFEGMVGIVRATPSTRAGLRAKARRARGAQESAPPWLDTKKQGNLSRLHHTYFNQALPLQIASIWKNNDVLVGQPDPPIGSSERKNHGGL